MAYISKAIPSLFNGVSQQPASLRNPGQAEASDNAYPSVAVGLRKRPGTEHVAKLRNSTATDAGIYILNDPTDGKYIVVMLDTDLEIYREDGTACTITFTHGKNYLDCTTPRSELVAVPVSDYTLILNKDKGIGMGGTTVPGSLTSTVQTFSALPTATGSGNIHKVQGDNTNAFTSYYVKDVAAGVWEEWLKPGEAFQLDASTLPHKLTKTGVDTFTFARHTWTDRAKGELATVQNPSFVSRKISDMFVWQNRLGVLTEGFVVLSQPGVSSAINWFRGSAQATLATDPIDYTTPLLGGSKLRYALPFNKALLMFSDTSQLQASAGTDALTKDTFRIDPVTTFEFNKDVRPVQAGQEVFFTQDRGSYSSVRTYFIDVNSLTNDASEITGHIPAYLPSGLFKLAVSTSDDTLAVLSTSQRNRMWIYKFYWQEDKKVQSAWQTWTLDAQDTILSVECVNQYAYLVVQRADGVYLERMNLQPNYVDDVGYQIALDRLDSITGSYDSVNNWTTWTLPYADTGTFFVVVGPDFTGKVGAVLATTRPTNTTVRVAGADYSADPCWVGRSYTMRHRLSEIYFKDDQGLPLLTGKLMLKFMSVNYSRSGYFRIEVTPAVDTSRTYQYVFNGKFLGTSSLLIGQPNIATGFLRVALQAENIGTIIEIVNDSPLPSILQSAEWEGEFVLRSQRQR